MSALTGQPWFWPALIVVVGLPLALLLLQELHASLVRRGSAYAKPVRLLRNWVFPIFAIYLLVDQLEHSDVNATWSKISATVVGFLVILLLLSAANAALFGEAQTGTWRGRLPSIFVDLGQFILIIIGIGLLLSWVWGANIGGLVTAVGVTSVVIGLAVQGAVGPIIAGLLLLFEQPFRIGDWLETPTVKGRVVEVNWRAIHIDTFNGIQVVPNATLAAASFTNLSRAVRRAEVRRRRSSGSGREGAAVGRRGAAGEARRSAREGRAPRGWPVQGVRSGRLARRRFLHPNPSAAPSLVCRATRRPAHRPGDPQTHPRLRGDRTAHGR